MALLIPFVVGMSQIYKPHLKPHNIIWDGDIKRENKLCMWVKILMSWQYISYWLIGVGSEDGVGSKTFYLIDNKIHTELSVVSTRHITPNAYTGLYNDYWKAGKQEEMSLTNTNTAYISLHIFSSMCVREYYVEIDKCILFTSIWVHLLNQSC